jgi:arsenate reductase (thioredoxin)
MTMHSKHGGAARSFALTIILIGAAIVAGAPSPPASAAESIKQVLFVCERGNVKSLMAASYFNQLATERNLPLRAISRGVAPNSTSVPPAIIAGLASEGIEVSKYRPQALDAGDASKVLHVVTIGTDLPRSTRPADANVERWDDVPAASTNYDAARDSLRVHVRDLVERLGK